MSLRFYLGALDRSRFGGTANADACRRTFGTACGERFSEPSGWIQRTGTSCSSCSRKKVKLDGIDPGVTAALVRICVRFSAPSQPLRRSPCPRPTPYYGPPTYNRILPPDLPYRHLPGRPSGVRPAVGTEAALVVAQEHASTRRHHSRSVRTPNLTDPPHRAPAVSQRATLDQSTQAGA